ncbi:hypothetical protein B0H15DRAFT_817610 [Mycena belliarum]|uniref:Uncharacterized protein n=1 Tax=Mycena belliarum TaxID=1033014 RepID=A0AAD6XWF9_9AGAR|nr:hypothetical protein B0H15DRAFT_817610 [Mycena belliae]
MSVLSRPSCAPIDHLSQLSRPVCRSILLTQRPRRCRNDEHPTIRLLRALPRRRHYRRRHRRPRVRHPRPAHVPHVPPPAARACGGGRGAPCCRPPADAPRAQEHRAAAIRRRPSARRPARQRLRRRGLRHRVLQLRAQHRPRTARGRRDGAPHRVHLAAAACAPRRHRRQTADRPELHEPARAAGVAVDALGRLAQRHQARPRARGGRGGGDARVAREHGGGDRACHEHGARALPRAAARDARGARRELPAATVRAA